MRRIVFLHPSIHNLGEMISYLCLNDVCACNSLVWDPIQPEIVIASEHIYKNYYLMKRLKNYYNSKAILIYHAGEASFPDLTIFDYAIAINTRLTNLDRIIRIPPSVFYSRSTIKSIKHNTATLVSAKNELNSKTEFCNFIYSNPVAHPMRDKLFFAISNYKKVDSLGSHLNNKNNKTSRREKNWAVLSVNMKKSYKFTIASENALFDGYTSEKLLTSFQAHSVPIYWGNPYVAEEFNQDAFINCHAFDSVDKIIEKIIEVDNNDDIWEKMVSSPWQTEEQIKKTNIQMRKYERFMTKIFTLDLCALERRPKGTFPNIYSSWFFKMYRTKNVFLESLKNRIKRIFKKR